MEELRIMKGKGENFIEEIRRQTELSIEMTKDYIWNLSNKRKIIQLKTEVNINTLIKYCILLNK